MNRLLLVFLWILFHVASQAQIVNIETQRKGEDNKPFFGKTDLSFNVNKTTSLILSGRNQTQLQYHHLRNKYIFLSDLQMMMVDTVRYLNNGFLHFRYNHDFKNEWLIAEAFTQVQYNRIQKILRRFLWGAGTRFLIINNEKYKVFAGLATMYEFELYIDNTFQDKVRMSNYFTLDFNPLPHIRLRHTTYYQPNISMFSDYRLTNETSMEATIYKGLSFKSQFNHYFDSKPAPAVQKVFYSFSNGLIYRF
jgi:hypothetical protein